ncbi:methyltransferase [Streptomyces sp. NPDC026589]|uniref:SAM-dependent methyltransferase n=1 Tax=Streptomyces sp. NPDC026589 TaxID=3155609 RepID=UPI0033FA4063
MNPQLVYELAHVDHAISNPVDDESARQLLRRTVYQGDERVLDLGCGDAAWLLSVLAAHPGVTAEGVDISLPPLARARERATALGVEDRLVLHHRRATKFTSPQPFDAVFCVGAAHAFGGLLPALDAMHGHLTPGGRVLVGDGFWEGEPSPEARGIFGDCEDLATTIELVERRGWMSVYGHVSTRQELDDYEWNWTGSLAKWALDHPDDPNSAMALAKASTHRSEWLRDYRSCWGFLTLVLRRTS